MTPAVAAATNSFTCHQELTLSNIHFFPAAIQLWNHLLVEIDNIDTFNHYCSYLLTLLVFSLLTNHVHYTRD